MLDRRAFEAHVGYFAALTERGAGSVLDAGGVFACASVHPLPFLINVVARTDSGADAATVLENGTDFFAGHGRERFEVLALAGRDDDLIAAAVERGMKPSPPDPIQVLDAPLDASIGPAPPEVSVRWASTPADVADVVTVTTRAHRVYGFSDDVWPAIFGRDETIVASDLGVVIATRDGKPVATAQLHLSGTTGYVGWVAVVPEAGRVGLGSYVTRLVVDWGFERGIDVAVLLASPMGAPVYRRMGFRDVGGLAGATFA